ncbi:zinc-dependent alcohol dehydrogenase family protein [Kribbella solani]|uniref:zinc-dependent alcohol dehydrogenase family protein n=1 Tax=Kribbella solani TaxID=236067 RepID=UPI0029A19CF1|nr:zinc-dependent alcohol dehydrogenase family protein [Kribbella solani]MDX2971750.1 zinc-dependent alcohol dehydrogenase family protein [Kribbella solani]MDX3005488.1 zinc-dependent alcohol dehydrogenase family protein [Kribbella solani]
MTDEMYAWVVDRPGPIDTAPLRKIRRPIPEPGPGEVLVEVEACGICRTDLHLCEGDLPPKHLHITPGHQTVGTVVAHGPSTTRTTSTRTTADHTGGDRAAPADRFAVGERVGIAWLRGTCGGCEFCRRGAENLCPRSTYTGWDAHGGFAEYAVVPQDFAYALPPDRPAIELAPFLCAGIIGYRALLRANLPPGGRLGIYGFGSSAHLTAQLATAQGAELFVMTRGEQNRVLARALGAVFVGETADRPPAQLDSAIVFAPAGDVVPYALEAVRPGGTVAVAGIHLSDVPVLNYERHLFHERDLRSVTSNTRRDGEELFRLIARLEISAHTTAVPFDAVDRALADVAHGRASGSLVALR